MSDVFSKTIGGISRRIETIEPDGRITEEFISEAKVPGSVEQPAEFEAQYAQRPAERDDVFVPLSDVLASGRDPIYMSCRGCGESILVDDPEHENIYINGDGTASVFCGCGPSCCP